VEGIDGTMGRGGDGQGRGTAGMFSESRTYVSMRKALSVGSWSHDTRMMLLSSSGVQIKLDYPLCAMEEMVVQDYSCLVYEESARSG
jgi:hypothetical protein